MVSLTDRLKGMLSSVRTIAKRAASAMSSAAINTAVPPSLTGSPTKALVPPGKCQLTSEFTAVALLERTAVSSTSSVLRFATPEKSEPLNLSTCACILAKADLPSQPTSGEATEVVVRPYTPISTNAQVGSFDLLVKHYPEGLMSQHMLSMPIGSTLEFKHIEFNVKLQYEKFQAKQIGMIVGGTGITPMLQALHAILGDSESKAKVSMLYGSQVSSDILGNKMLSKWASNYSDKLSVTHVLSHEPEDSSWDGARGFINKELIEKHLPAPSLGDDAIIFVCGPPPMYNALSGPRGEDEVKGVLAEMGFSSSQVYKF
jgi:cytochrome-b5 reductase